MKKLTIHDAIEYMVQKKSYTQYALSVNNYECNPYTQEGGRLSILVLASLSFVMLLNASIMCCAAIKIVLFPYFFTFSGNDGACVIYLTFLGLS